MTYAQDAIGPLTLSAYRYDGTRPNDAGLDRFRRAGFGIVYDQWGRFSSESVLQTGWDSNCGLTALTGCASSGGFTQLRYALARRWYVLARYEGTQDPTNGFTRDTVGLLGYAPSENSRITIEDVIARSPVTTHTMNVQFTIGY